MTRANLVGAVAIVIAIVFQAPPVYAQRPVSGHGLITRATLPPRVSTINSYRPRYHRPGVGVPTPGYQWVGRGDYPLKTWGYTHYRAVFPLYANAYWLHGGNGYALYGYPYEYGDSIPLSEYRTLYGAVRLEIPQDDAEVYVDGYYAGTVDDFDGRLQELQLEPGQHRIEVRGRGYEPLAFDVNIQGGLNIVYRQTLQPSHP